MLGLPAALSMGWQRGCDPALVLFLLGKLSCHAPEPCPTQGAWHPGASPGSSGCWRLAVFSQEGPRTAVGCGQSLHKAREERN